MSQSRATGLVFVGTAITPLHPGAGRSPGLVDLPVQRDALGYPLVYASSLKGALKTLCAKVASGVGGQGCIKGNGNRDAGRIDCENCRDCCCLFGGEVGEGEKGAGKLAFLDMVPWAYPVPSATHGYLYVTAPTLLARVFNMLEAAGYVKQAREVQSLIVEAEGRLGGDVHGVVLSDSRVQSGMVDVAGSTMRVERIGVETSSARWLTPDTLGPLAKSTPRRLIIVSDEYGTVIVNRALLRVTRVALRRDRKTVRTGALWTEEYIPIGTLFVTGVVETLYTNEYCDKAGIEEGKAAEKLLELLARRNNTIYVNVGGKETVGRGFVKMVAVKG